MKNTIAKITALVACVAVMASATITTVSPYHIEKKIKDGVSVDFRDDFNDTLRFDKKDTTYIKGVITVKNATLKSVCEEYKMHTINAAGQIVDGEWTTKYCNNNSPRVDDKGNYAYESKLIKGGIFSNGTYYISLRLRAESNTDTYISSSTLKIFAHYFKNITTANGLYANDTTRGYIRIARTTQHLSNDTGHVTSAYEKSYVAVAKPGYKFKCWQATNYNTHTGTCVSTKDSIHVKISSDTTLAAIFDENPFYASTYISSATLDGVTKKYSSKDQKKNIDFVIGQDSFEISDSLSGNGDMYRGIYYSNKTLNPNDFIIVYSTTMKQNDQDYSYQAFKLGSVTKDGMLNNADKTQSKKVIQNNSNGKIYIKGCHTLYDASSIPQVGNCDTLTITLKNKVEFLYKIDDEIKVLTRSAYYDSSVAIPTLKELGIVTHSEAKVTTRWNQRKTGKYLPDNLTVIEHVRDSASYDLEYNVQFEVTVSVDSDKKSYWVNQGEDFDLSELYPENPTPADTNYVFVGWKIVNNNGRSASTSNIKSPINISATFEKRYAVYIAKNKCGTGKMEVAKNFIQKNATKENAEGVEKALAEAENGEYVQVGMAEGLIGLQSVRQQYETIFDFKIKVAFMDDVIFESFESESEVCPATSSDSEDHFASSDSKDPGSSGSDEAETSGSSASKDPASSGSKDSDGKSSSSVKSSSSKDKDAIVAMGMASNISASLQDKVLVINGINNFSVEVFDMQGRPVLMKKVEAAGSAAGSATISLEGLKSGSYIVRVHNGSAQYLRRITVK